MYTRILVPLAGSRLAEQVLPYVRVFASALGSPIELLQVSDSNGQGWGESVQAIYLDRLINRTLERAHNYLKDTSELLGDLGVPVSGSTRKGDPASLIARCADEEPNTLIAMCTHGRSGPQRWALGSVTDKVLHVTGSPMLVVRSLDETKGPREVDLNSVIVPLDGSALAEQVLPHVVTLANALHLSTFLVKVAPPDSARYRDYLDEVADELLQQGVNSVKGLILEGHPATTIVDFGRDISRSLIAMTTHGRSGVGRWVLGSVTDQVMRQSAGPVLVIRPGSRSGIKTQQRSEGSRGNYSKQGRKDHDHRNYAGTEGGLLRYHPCQLY